MASLEIFQFPCLSDNYGVLVHDQSENVTASIDAPEAAAVKRALSDKGWKLTHILNTHHHWDHTGGNEELKAETGCTIVGPANEASQVPGIDVEAREGDLLKFGSHRPRIIDTGGHTSGHIAYWFPEGNAAFVGDTLFALGCGRIFEGNPHQMWNSLHKLTKLPPETAIYCGHEYTANNAKFALTIEPENEALQARAKEIEALRAKDQPTIPTNMGLELETNPFLRPDSPAIRSRLGMKDSDDWEVFAEIRKLKDSA